MGCEDEYSHLTKTTERLHELYYQQENARAVFYNILTSVQGQLVSSGLSRLVTASPAEILDTLEDEGIGGFEELKSASESRVKIDDSVLAAEKSYLDASNRYEECIERITKIQ